MTDANKSIADAIKDGQYFIDSKNWYYNKYVYPSVERAFMALITSALCLVLLALFVFTASTTSEVLESTYAVNMPDTIKREARFRILDAQIEPHIALNNYMLGYYVAAREEYNFADLDVQLIKMSNLSTLAVYNEFKNFMSINNVNSPQFVYQKDNTRSVHIDSIQYIAPNKAEVSFTATSNWSMYNKKDQSQWIATLDFAVSDLEVLLKKNSKRLDFVVVSYNVKKARL
jgi:type IV secretory pathway component VirB8